MKKEKLSVKDISLIALFSALITVCAWLSLPIMTVPVTLQTFGVFLTLLLLGGKNGTVSVLIYILLGLVGVPVFSGFKSGPSVLLGPTGGYIVGFILTGIIYYVFEKFVSEKITVKLLSLALGLAVCYAFGTAWFIIVFSKTDGAVTVLSALGMCVFPFIVPDMIKLALAFTLYKALSPALRRIKN